MKQGYWVVRTYRSGCVGEKIKYWVEGEKPTRSKRKLRQDIKKREQNEASAEKRVARLINANFSAGDILLGLDYNDEGLRSLIRDFDFGEGEEIPEERELLYQAAVRALERCLRRCRRPLGDKLRYIAVTSDMDGESKEEVRVHHHLVIPEDCLEVFKEKWTLGGVHWEKLRNQRDYTPIAAYLMRQVRHVADAKKYKPSKNLVRPEPKDRVAKNGAELRVPPKAQLLQRAEFVPGMPQYIRYILPEFSYEEIQPEAMVRWEERRRIQQEKSSGKQLRGGSV